MVRSSLATIRHSLFTIHKPDETMKYICLGYIDERLWDSWSQSEQKKFMDECFHYDAELRKNGHFVGGEALQSVKNATTIRQKGEKVVVTDGPFAETKEQLGGIMILEARDLNHAIQLMSKHPSVRMGTTWEIRPADEQVNELSNRATRTKERGDEKENQTCDSFCFTNSQRRLNSQR